MRFSKRLLFRRAAFFLVPLLGSPLLFFGKELQCVFVILVMSLFWLIEVLPMGVVSLLPMFLFPVMNILPASGVSACYFKKNVVLFMTSLIMSISVEEVQLHRRIAIGSLRLFGANRLCILFGLMLTTAFVSFFVSDTASTVLMLPIVISILSTLHEAEENSSEKSISQTTSTSSEKSDQEIKKSPELDLTTMSKRDKGFCKAMVLATTHASLIGGTGIITGTGTNLVFREQIHSVYPDQEMVTYLEWMSFALPWVPLYLVASWLVLTLVFMPCELFPRRCQKEREKEKEVAVSIKEKMLEAKKSLGRMTFAEGSVIFWFLVLLLAWMSRNPGFTKGWSSLMAKDYVSDSTVAVFVAALMFIWPRDLADTELKPILTWEHMKQKYAWDCTLLIGAGFAISAGVDKSGLGNLIACQMNYLFQDMNRFCLQVLATLIVCFLTEFASNIATAGIFIPIMISLSKGLSLHPLYLVVPVTISCSFAFCLPIATPGNAIVYASKIVSMVDMVFSGVILNIVCVWLTVLNYNTLAYHLLKLDQLPTAVSAIDLKCGNWSFLS